MLFKHSLGQHGNVFVPFDEPLYLVLKDIRDIMTLMNELNCTNPQYEEENLHRYDIVESRKTCSLPGL